MRKKVACGRRPHWPELGIMWWSWILFFTETLRVTCFEASVNPDLAVPPLLFPVYFPTNIEILNSPHFYHVKQLQQDLLLNASLKTRTEAFMVYRASVVPVIQASFPPFSVKQDLPVDLLTSGLALISPDGEILTREVQTFVVEETVSPSRPWARVLFHLTGLGLSAEGSLPCVHLHAFSETLEVRSSCRIQSHLRACLAEVLIPLSWFGAPDTTAEHRSDTIRLYYTLDPPGSFGSCNQNEDWKKSGSGWRWYGVKSPQEMLIYIGAVVMKLTEALPVEELRLDRSVLVRLPHKTFRPGEVFSGSVTVAANFSGDMLTLRLKLKKGLNVISTQSSDPDRWKVKLERSHGSKHHVAVITCRQLLVQNDLRSSGDFYELLKLEFENENITRAAVTRRISWQVEYPGRGPQLETDKVISEIVTVQNDILNIFPLAMETEIINTAILTGKPINVPVRVVAVEEMGQLMDLSGSIGCRAINQEALKVSEGCDYVFVNGKESYGGEDITVEFTYEHLSALLHLTVWVPRLPLRMEISDTTLSQVKGWKARAQSEKSSHIDEEEAEWEEEEDRRSGGCTPQYQRTNIQVLAHFVARPADGRSQLTYMLGPDWLADVTHLVSDVMQVRHPHIAHLKMGGILIGREPGVTSVQVLSPVSKSILAEQTVIVTEEKVTLTDLQVQLVSGISLSLRPGHGQNQIFFASATAQETLHMPKQEAALNIWLAFSDHTMSPLNLYSQSDYILTVFPEDQEIILIHQDSANPNPIVVVKQEGYKIPLRLEMEAVVACQRHKRRSVLAVGKMLVSVRFNSTRGVGTKKQSSDGAETGQSGHDGRVDTGQHVHRHKGSKQKSQGQGSVGGTASHTEHPVGREEGSIKVASKTRVNVFEGNHIGEEDWLLSRKKQNSEDTSYDSEAPRTRQHVPSYAGKFPVETSRPSDDGSSKNNYPSVLDYYDAESDDDEEEELVKTPKSRTDLEIGLYVLLGVFCLAILVFLVNCVMFILRYQHKQIPAEATDIGRPPQNWVWQGNENDAAGRQVELVLQSSNRLSSTSADACSPGHALANFENGREYSTGDTDLSGVATTGTPEMTEKHAGASGTTVTDSTLPCSANGVVSKSSQGSTSVTNIQHEDKDSLPYPAIPLSFQPEAKPHNTTGIQNRQWTYGSSQSTLRKLPGNGCGQKEGNYSVTTGLLQDTIGHSEGIAGTFERIKLGEEFQTVRRKRVHFTTFLPSPPSDIPPVAQPDTHSILVASEEDIKWVCEDMGLKDPEELRNYMEKIRESS